MDILEFAETTGVKLTDHQKKFVKELYEGLEKGERPVICMPPRMGRTQIINLIESFKEVKNHG